MASHDADKVLGAGWGNTEELYRAHWLWITSPVLTGIGECHDMHPKFSVLNVDNLIVSVNHRAMLLLLEDLRVKRVCAAQRAYMLGKLSRPLACILPAPYPHASHRLLYCRAAQPWPAESR